MSRGLILDFGGVVTTDFYAALSGFCVRQGLPADALLRVLRDDPEGRAALAAVEKGEITQREYEVILARLLGVDDQDLVARILADLQPCEPVLALIDRARSENVAVAVLSNSWGTGAVDPYAGYDLDQRCDAVVISDQVGLHKPDPAIFELTAEKLGVPPPSCVFVDDTAHNLPPAARLGMTVVHFRDVVSGVAEIEASLDLA